MLSTLTPSLAMYQ